MIRSTCAGYPLLSRLTLALIGLTLTMQLNGINLNYEKVRKNLKGIKSYEKEDYLSANQHFNENVIENPQDGTLHFNLGNNYHKMGQHDAAIIEYARALRDDSFKDKSLIYHNLGNTLFEQEKYKEALESFRNALISNSENQDSRYNYELLKQLMQRMQEEEQESEQSGEGDKQEQQDMTPAEESDSQDGEEAEIAKREEGDDEKSDDADPERQKKLENAEELLRALMTREKDLLEKERDRVKDAKPLKGRFW
ncbi:MAG: tetratricopeptide repeat protein [Candidatus Cloacimonadia bacterium]